MSRPAGMKVPVPDKSFRPNRRDTQPAARGVMQMHDYGAPQSWDDGWRGQKRPASASFVAKNPDESVSTEPQDTLAPGMPTSRVKVKKK